MNLLIYLKGLRIWLQNRGYLIKYQIEYNETNLYLNTFGNFKKINFNCIKMRCSSNLSKPTSPEIHLRFHIRWKQSDLSAIKHFSSQKRVKGSVSWHILEQLWNSLQSEIYSSTTKNQDTNYSTTILKQNLVRLTSMKTRQFYIDYRFGGKRRETTEKNTCRQLYTLHRPWRGSCRGRTLCMKVNCRAVWLICFSELVWMAF